MQHLKAPPKCPTCDSPSPKLHPAMQFEGEVQICKDKWHDWAKSQYGNDENYR